MFLLLLIDLSCAGYISSLEQGSLHFTLIGARSRSACLALAQSLDETSAAIMQARAHKRQEYTKKGRPSKGRDGAMEN